MYDYIKHKHNQERQMVFVTQSPLSGLDDQKIIFGHLKRIVSKKIRGNTEVRS